MVETQNNNAMEVYEEDLIDDEGIVQSEIRKRQVATVRNKAYIFFLGLFLFIFRPTFLTPIEKMRGKESFSINLMNPVQSMFNDRGKDDQGLLGEIDELDIKITGLDDQKKIIEIEKLVVNHLSDDKKQLTLGNCINYNICDGIHQLLIDRLDLLRIFMIVGSLQGNKMSFDQKTLLRSINENLLIGKSGNKLANLTGITFNNTKVFDKDTDLREVGITMNVGVSSKENMSELLDNIENRIFDIPILYVVESVNYDVVDFDKKQEIGLNVKVYFFGDSFVEQQIKIQKELQDKEQKQQADNEDTE